MYRQWGRWTVLCLLCAAWAGPGNTWAQDPQPSGHPLRVNAGTDVVDRWQAQQHLYVKGDVAVGAEQQDQLEAWLDQNAQNWTVVLLESGQGERYTDPEGRQYTGLDAVEQCLGKGLANRTGFGQLTDPRTGERNGAFFMLFLKDRKFSYYASDAMDRRGLGEDHWQGNLDQAAVAAMRSGGRVADAVKDTITLVETRLTRRIEAEKAEARRREESARLELQKTVDRARLGLRSAAESVERLGLSVSEAQEAHPEVRGDILRPDLDRMRADLAGAAAALDGGNAPAAGALAEEVRGRAEKARKAIEDHRLAGQELTDLGARLDSLAGRPYAHAAVPDIDEARTVLAGAREVHGQGDSTYVVRMQDLRTRMGRVEARIAAAAFAANQRRFLVRLAGGTGLATVLLVGLSLNLRRRRSRREALAMIDTWSKAINEKTLALFDLLNQTHDVLGSSSDEVATRHTGRTLDLARQVVEDVDEMVIMSACASRVLETARLLARPDRLARQFVNVFAVRHYRAALRRLRDDPVVFSPDEGLEFIIRGPRTQRETLLGPVESYQPFTMTFQELIDAFNQRAGRAVAGIGQVDGSVNHLADVQKASTDRIREVSLLEPELRTAAGPSTSFTAGLVFSDLLPAAQRDHADAAKLAVRDPVGTLETLAASAKSKAEDGLAIARLAADFHAGLRQQMASAAQVLAEASVDAGWMAVSVETLSDRLDQVTRQALKESQASQIAVLAADLRTLVDRAERVVQIDKARREVAIRSIDEALASIAQARQDLGQAGGLAADAVLHEQGSDPDDRVDKARSQVAAVKAALERGDVETADQGLAEVADLTQEIAGVLKATREAFGAHDATAAACRKGLAEITAQVPRHRRVLEDIEKGYAASVLLLGEGDPTHPRVNDTIQDNLDEVTDHLTETGRMLDLSEARHRSGGFLDAAATLARAAARHEQATFRLQEIMEKQQRLAATEMANARQRDALEHQVGELQTSVEDSRTTEPTAAAFDQARQRLGAAVRLMQASPANPFAAAAELQAAGQMLASVEDQVRCDWAIRSEAERRISEAASQLEAAQRMAHQAQTDHLADSAALQQAYRDGEILAERLRRRQTDLGTPHGRWAEVRQEADEVFSGAGRLAAILHGELEAGQAAAAALATAAQVVGQMSAWRGGLGVTLFGSPASRTLDQARALLASGSYVEALRLSESARREARAAIAEAAAEQRRRLLAEQERLERERRSRLEEERRRHDAWSHSGIGSSGFGRSTFSSGSGVSHSSFSRGSGVSRSGW